MEPCSAVTRSQAHGAAGDCTNAGVASSASRCSIATHSTATQSLWLGGVSGGSKAWVARRTVAVL
jgi:hypothetical protein